MNNRICWLFILALFPAYLRAQSITPNTLNNGGGTAASMDWNMGESVSIANFSTPNYFLNTGVLQPLTTVVTAINEYGPAVYGNQITIGPNPTTNLVHFKGNFTQTGKLSIQVIDATTGADVHNFQGEQGFVRGTLRALARGRRLQGMGADQPFELIAHDAGRLSLRDPATGATIALESFGSTNIGVFARLMQ